MTDPRTLIPTAIAEFPARYAQTARFSTGTPRNLTVTDSGSTVLFCRSNAPDDPVLCLWAVDVADGSERLLVDPRTIDSEDAELPAAERARRERARESASGIVAFSVDRSGRTVCFALSGALFVVDIDSGRVRSPEIEGSVFDPRLDPTGASIAYVDGPALRVITADGFEPVLERVDADPLVGHGRAEFIAAEEMGRYRGHWWAPDGAGILVARVDENSVDEWWIADPAHPDRQPNPIRYPGAGTTNATVALELVALDGTARTVDWDDDGRYEYLADVLWAADRQPLIVRETRDQRLVSMAELDPGDLSLSEKRRITDDTWVELIPGSPAWSDHGLLTIEDIDGARRLMLDGEGRGDPDINVRSIVGVVADDSSDRFVVVSAWTEPSEIHLLAIPIGPQGGDPVPLTNAPGIHGAVLGGSTMVRTAAEPDRPGTVVTIATLDTATLAISGVATVADHSTDPGFRAEPGFTVLGSDRLNSAVFLPSWHDGESTLPVLLDPYGGPHAQRVLKAHNPHLVSRWLAEQGYAVLVTDGRGTPGRGPQFERAVYGNLADPVLDDQLAALDDLLATNEFLDGDRVGIRGWSFGGYLAALAVLRRPDRFHAAIAGAPVTRWELYDTHYTERYLSHPAKHPEHYEASNLFTEGTALNLDRPLLLIHGLADDNVVAAHSLRFSTELLASGCAHQVLPLSGVTHMTPQEAVAENLLRLQLRFLDDTIGQDTM